MDCTVNCKGKPQTEEGALRKLRKLRKVKAR